MSGIKAPKNQIVWMTYNVDGVPKYLVTSDKMRNKYTLHKVNKDGSVEKLKTSVSPCFKEVGDYEK